MLQDLAIASIRLYQRYLSPYKGYRCAYSLKTGRSGCSGVGLRAIRRYGLWRGWVVLRRRLQRCGEVYAEQYAQTLRPPLQQRGECDPGFIDLDVCSGPASRCFESDSLIRRLCSLPLDCLSSGCGCDWPQRKTRYSDSKSGVIQRA